ncbi:MAG: Acetyl esterase/lipase [Gemmatimonadetes bacterium]|nr:Acetyl esterase/lipase [Gemmatimonadota bacterium]
MPSKQALEVKQHWETMAALGQTLPLDEQRDLIEKEWPKLTGEPRGVDFAEVDVDGLTAMWITPKGAAEDRTILAIHGGGYVSGSIYTHRKMFGHLAKAAGCRALSIEYRRTPEHVHPAAIDDVFGAYRWILRHGLEPRKVAFVGDSCGGGLALSALLRARDEKLPLPAGAMALSAWVDMTVSGETFQSNRDKDLFFRREVVGGLVQMLLGPSGDRRDPRCSPLFGDLKGLPPIYLQVGADEALLDESRRFAQEAKSAGVDVLLDIFPDMLHTFQMTAGRAPEADDAIRRLATWVRPRLGLDP